MSNGKENQGVRIKPTLNLGNYSLGKRLEELEPRVVDERTELYMEDLNEQMYDGIFDTIKFGRYSGLKKSRQPTTQFLKDIKNQFLMLCLRKYCDRKAILEPLDNEQITSLIHEVGRALLDLKRPIKPDEDLSFENIRLSEPLADMYRVENGDTVYYHGLERLQLRHKDIPESYITKIVEVTNIEGTAVYELMSDGFPQDILSAEMHPTDLRIAHRLKEDPEGINEYAYTIIKKPGPTPEESEEDIESISHIQ